MSPSGGVATSTVSGAGFTVAVAVRSLLLTGEEINDMLRSAPGH